MFPAGLVGVALLVLRVCVALTIVINAADSLATGTSSWVIIGFILSAFLLCLGLLTPYVSILSALVEIGVLLYAGGNHFQWITSIVGC